MKKSKQFDIWSYIVVLIVCATAYYITLGFTGVQISLTSSDPMGPGGFPRLLIGVAAVLSVIGIINAVIRKDGDDKPKLTMKNCELLLKFILAFSAYIFAIRYVGYCVSTMLYAMFNMWWMGVRAPRTIITTGVALVLILYTVFGLFLKVQLPTGFLI